MESTKTVDGAPANEWQQWADYLIEKVTAALTHGISAEQYAGYPSPVAGFCFELHADLPYSRPLLLAEVKSNLANMPAFQALDTQFRLTFGCPILAGTSPAPQLEQHGDGTLMRTAGRTHD